MPRRYSSDGSQNAAASVSVLGLTSTAAIRPKIYEVIFGSSATPADQAFSIQLNRYTAAGTATGVTPTALDPGDAAATASAGENHSVEPTYTAGAVLLAFSINQQATFRWVAAPDGELVAPSTAANGIGMRFILVSGGTALCEATFHHAE